MIKGIDISAIQGKVDFMALAASGVQFCVIRCGVGNSGIDSLYSQNVAGAKAAGLQVACYHFVYPLPPLASQPLRDPVKQAQYHFNAAQGVLACCDYEWPAPQDWAKWGCTADQINTWCLSYLAEYERLSGQKMIVYTYPYFAASLKLPVQFADYSLWIASYEPTPTIPQPWSNWVLWQNTGGGGRLPTTGVPVDTDLANDLSVWNTSPNVVTPSVPVPTPVLVPTPVPMPVPVPTPTPVPVVPSPTTPTIQEISSIFGAIFRWIASCMSAFKEP